MILSGGAAGVRFRSSTSLRFRDLVCPSPASSSSRPRYRVYPWVVEVVSEVAVHAAALHRCSNLLSAILPRQIRCYAVAIQPLFAAPQPVNPSFSRLAGAAAVGSMRWGSVTFAEMEHLGRLFRCRLEATSSSLWMMSGILAMLKHDGFNPSTPGLFNTAIASVSASLAFSGAYGGIGVCVPSLYRWGVSTDAFEGPDSRAAETRTHSHPVSVTGLFDEPLLNSVAAQVTEDSFVSSSLAVSRLCPPAPVPSLWLCPRCLSPVHLATVPSGAAVGAALCVLLALWRPQALQGWSGVGSFFETFGFPEVGAIALPYPVRWLSVPPLAGLEGQGRSSVGGGGPPGGVSHTLPPASSSVYGIHPHAFVCPYFHRRGCSRGGHLDVDCQACCGACSSSLSRLFQLPVSGLEDLGVVASGHRPVPAQSLRGHFPTVAWYPSSLFSCQSDRGIGWPPSIFGRRILRFLCIRNFVASCALWLMAALTDSCVVLRSVHGPAGLPSGYGSCICSSFLGYPYVSLPGRLACPGIVPGGPPPGSRGCLVPLSRVGDRGQPGVVQLLSISGGTLSRGGHRRTDFYGFSIARSRLQAAIPLRRILSSTAPPACLWQSLLGLLSSLSHLVPGGRLWMSSLRICLHRSWDRLSPSAPVPWPLDCLWDLWWWLCGDRFSRGVSLLQVSPVLAFWSDASDVGLGPLVGDRVVSSLWDQSEALLPVNARELMAVHHGLLHFQSFLSGTTVAVFCGNVTAVPYLLKVGGVPVSCSRHHCPGDPPLGGISSDSIGSAVLLGIRNVLADSLSRPHQLPSSAWSLNLDVFRSLRRWWLVMFDLCATSDHHRFSIFFSPYQDPLSAGSDALLQSWDDLLACAFPPWSILPRALAKLKVSHRTLLTLVAQYWPQCPWFVDRLQLSVAPPVPLSARQTSSSSLGLVAATRVSTVWPFMPGDCPAPHQGGWFLLGGGCAGFVGTPSIIALHLPAQVVGLPVMVPLPGPLHPSPR